MRLFSIPSVPPLWQRVAGFGLAFWAGAETGQFLSVMGSTYVSFWLPAGIYVAVLLLNPTRTWPWFMLAAMVANLAYDLPHGTTFGTASGFYTANTMEALSGAWLVRRFVTEKPELQTLKEFLGLATCSAGLSTVVGATIGAATLVGSGMNNSFPAAWKTWWGNEAMAILLVAPFILVWFSRSAVKHPVNRRGQWIEAALLFSGLVGVTWFLLVDYRGIMGPYKVWLLLFLLWAALRFGLRGATLANLALALLMGFLITRYLKGLTPEEIAAGAYVPILQSFLGVSVVMTLVPAIVLHERDRKVVELRESEARFRQLTEASFEAVCISENGRILDVNDQGLKMMGYSREEVIGRELIDCIAPESQAAAAVMIRNGLDGTYEHRIIRKDGSSFYAEARAKMVRLGDRTVRMTAVRDVTELRQAKQALADSEMLLRHFIKQTPAAVAMFDQEMRYLQASDRWITHHHYKGENLIGRSHYDTFSNIPQRWREVHRRVLNGATERSDRDAFIRNDGTTEWVQWEAQPWLKTDGSIGGLIMSTQVITERIRIEEALRLSEDKFRSALQNSPIGMALVSPNGRWIEVNPALCKIVGYSQAELLATDFQTITHPDDLEADVNCVRRMLDRQTEGYKMEKRYVHKDGHTVWIQLNVSLVWNADGTPRYFVSQVQDITERKRAEAALHENQAKLVLAMDMAKLAHWEYDVPTDRFTFDERLLKYYGTNPAELGDLSMSSGDYVRKFVSPEDATLIAEEIAGGLAATDPNYTRQFEQRVIRSDGSTGVMLTRFTISKDASGRTIKGYGVNQDITDQKQAAQQQNKLEEQLRQAQKMEALGTLAGGTAHEFNNMLGIILGYSELIKTELGNGHPAQPDLEEILKAGQRAKEIIQQILTFSRQQRQPRELVPLTSVVRNALKAVRTTLPASVALHEDMADDNPHILGNPTQIHQVLTNIYINAWHAVEERGGNIRLTQKTVKLGRNAADIHPNLREGTYVHLAIADDGTGMDSATLKRIFEPFFTTKGHGKGTGLGLAVVHGIVQAHEGVVFAHSQPGSGTTFHLYFPTCPPTDSSPTKTKMETKPTPKSDHHILLVDDEPSLTQVTSKFLQRAGYRTTRVHSAVEALSAFEQQPASFSLVITDLTMPEMSGTALASALNIRYPNLPVIIVSGLDGTDTPNGDAPPNIKTLLQKPFTPNALIRTIQSVLAGKPDGKPSPV